MGRLKLREGNIEHALIHYHRSNFAGAKQSNVLVYQHQPDKTLKDILIHSLGIKIVVIKNRRIWYIDNVKFHFDYVEGLGSFTEVEAIDWDGSKDIRYLERQCAFYAEVLHIKPEQYIAESYSDMLLEK